MYRVITAIISKKIKSNFAELLVYADIKKDPNKYLGYRLIFSLLLSIFISVLLKILFKFPIIISLIGFIVLFILTIFILYFYVVLKADKKSEVVDGHLPDALQLMVSNLRAGLTIDRALLLSTRPEFGVLKDEINLVGKQITMGDSLTNALLNMTKRVRSKTFEKSILMIVSGLRSGGELVPLLEETADHLVQKRIVDKKIRSSVNLYVIFIFIAIGFGAPLLFGLSSYLMEILSQTISGAELPKTSSVNVPFTILSAPTIDKRYI